MLERTKEKPRRNDLRNRLIAEHLENVRSELVKPLTDYKPVGKVKIFPKYEAKGVTDEGSCSNQDIQQDA